MGILAAENVLSPGKHDLWSVNSDNEYQEEANANTQTTTAKSGRVSRRQQTLTVLKQFGGYLFTGGAATIIDVIVFSLLVQSGQKVHVFAQMRKWKVALLTSFSRGTLIEAPQRPVTYSRQCGEGGGGRRRRHIFVRCSFVQEQTAQRGIDTCHGQNQVL